MNYKGFYAFNLFSMMSMLMLWRSCDQGEISWIIQYIGTSFPRHHHHIIEKLRSIGNCNYNGVDSDIVPRFIVFPRLMPPTIIATQMKLWQACSRRVLHLSSFPCIQASGTVLFKPNFMFHVSADSEILIQPVYIRRILAFLQSFRIPKVCSSYCCRCSY